MELGELGANICIEGIYRENIYYYRILRKQFGGRGCFFFFFLNLLCSPRLYLFDQNAAKQFVKYYYNLIYSYYGKFSASLLQSSVSHDPSEIILICWFAAQKTFLIIINVKTVVLLNIFVETIIYLFRFLWWIEVLKTAFIQNQNLLLHYKKCLLCLFCKVYG